MLKVTKGTKRYESTTPTDANDPRSLLLMILNPLVSALFKLQKYSKIFQNFKLIPN
jgi:hypothetical protein